MEHTSDNLDHLQGAKYVAAHIQNVPRSGIRDFFDIVSSRKDVISLGIGEPDFVTPWHIREAAVFALDHGVTSYTANLGLLELRRSMSRYVEDSFGVSYDPETEVLVTVGVSEALDLAVRAFADPGDEIICHEPSYVSYGPVATFAFATPVTVTTLPEENFRLTAERVEPHITERTKLLLLNFPTNPTGAVLKRDDVEGLARLAVERDLVVIADEIYSELTYEQERVSIASLPGMKERTVFLNGFSKSWAMTGFRIGFACAPPAMIEAMMKIHQYTMMCAPVLSQKAAIEALENGRSDIVTMRDEYLRRRNFICSSFNDMGLPCHTPEGAFYAFPSIQNTGLSSTDFCLKLLDEHNVACVPGTAFGPSGEGFMRCSYATDMDDIKIAMERMASFLGNL